MTYESSEEAEVLKTFWRGAELENTVFAILDPGGKQLTRSSRGPHMLFKDSSALANYMDSVARYYKGAKKPQELPVVDTVRLGLNVAACDSRPLAIVVGENEKVKKVLSARLASLAWSDDFIGKLVYTAGSYSELGGISGLRPDSRGFIFVKPNDFGNKGQVLVQLGAGASIDDLKTAAGKVVSTQFKSKLSHHEHVMQGRLQGVEWLTQIPVTDRHAPNYRGARMRSGPPQRRGARFQESSGNHSSTNIERSKYIYTR